MRGKWRHGGGDLAHDGLGSRQMIANKDLKFLVHTSHDAQKTDSMQLGAASHLNWLRCDFLVCSLSTLLSRFLLAASGSLHVNLEAGPAV